MVAVGQGIEAYSHQHKAWQGGCQHVKAGCRQVALLGNTVCCMSSKSSRRLSATARSHVLQRALLGSLSEQ